MSQEQEVSQVLGLPVLPLRDIVVFPGMVVPLFVGRPSSIAAIKKAKESGEKIFLLSQKDAHVDDPNIDELYQLGCVGRILQFMPTNENTIKLLVEGEQRARVSILQKQEKYLYAEFELLNDEDGDLSEAEALMRQLREAFSAYAELKKRLPSALAGQVEKAKNTYEITQLFITQLPFKTDEKQALLEMNSLAERAEQVLSLLVVEAEILQTELRIRSRMKESMERSQRQYFLNEQMQAIQTELGEKDEFKSEQDQLETQVKETKLSEEARSKAERELKKLKMMNPMSPEASVVRNYLDWMLSIPWQKFTEDKIDLDAAQKVLDEDHCGLDKVKERIVEHLAVQRLVDEIKGPILCFVGPPGVGKTSLARSIARATGRKFVRSSLGGVRDEAEIRGHRRTYIGALPGKILQGMKKAGSSNPVFLLDEIDKLSSDFRGDPSSAMLEVLDPEQNNSFNDHYLDIDYDLSKVMFIATANQLGNIPVPLQDRLEIIRIPGYLDIEKLDIAQTHLLPKQLKANGLQDREVEFSEASLKTIMEEYTREAGVRQLEREISACCRKIAARVVREDLKSLSLNASTVKELLGVPRFRRDMQKEDNTIGVATGLAWTQAGGELLKIEVAVLPGKGKLITTGTLGKVMQESAQAAMSYVRSRAVALGLAEDFYQNIDVHIHVPEGATPKDGPSAGITLATALTSALTRIPVRSDVAMTGEITLRGRVLPIGGLKEKALAAYRLGIHTILIPEDNNKDVEEIPKLITDATEFLPMSHMDQVLRQTLAIADPEQFFAQLAAHELAQSQTGHIPSETAELAH